MRLTNDHWDGSETSIAIPGYGQFEVRNRVANVPDMAGAVLLYAQGGDKVGFREVREVIVVQPVKEEGAPAVAPLSSDEVATATTAIPPRETLESKDTPMTDLKALADRLGLAYKGNVSRADLCDLIDTKR